MTRQKAADAKERIADVLESVERTGEPVAFERDGREVAVLVSPEDFALLARLRREGEDRLDNAAADAASKEPGSVPWEDLKAELGL